MFIPNSTVKDSLDWMPDTSSPSETSMEQNYQNLKLKTSDLMVRDNL
jgi:hypothetical protein